MVREMVVEIEQKPEDGGVDGGLDRIGLGEPALVERAQCVGDGGLRVDQKSDDLRLRAGMLAELEIALPQIAALPKPMPDEVAEIAGQVLCQNPSRVRDAGGGPPESLLG